MNPRLLLIGAVLLAAAVLAYSVTRLCLHPAPSARGAGLRDMAFLTRDLGLAPDQANRISGIRDTLESQLAECCARHCAARARLMAALAAPDAPSGTTEPLIAAMSKAYEDSERATIAHVQEVRAILTPAQRARFDARLNECLCRSCSMPGGMPGKEAACP